MDSLISGEINKCDEDDDQSVEDLSCFKYAQIIFYDVERSFSKFESML